MHTHTHTKKNTLAWNTAVSVCVTPELKKVKVGGKEVRFYSSLIFKI